MLVAPSSVTSKAATKSIAEAPTTPSCLTVDSSSFFGNFQRPAMAFRKLDPLTLLCPQPVSQTDLHWYILTSEVLQAVRSPQALASVSQSSRLDFMSSSVDGLPDPIRSEARRQARLVSVSA